MAKISDVIRSHSELAAASAVAESMRSILQTQLDAMAGVCTTTRQALDRSYQFLATKLPEGRSFVMPDGQHVLREGGQVRVFPPGDPDSEA